MRDPSLGLRLDPPQSERPRNPLVWASDSDWREIAVDLVNRNICEFIDFADIAEVRRQEVLEGLMGVAEADNDRDSGPQRFIMNIKVSSWVAAGHSSVAQQWSMAVPGGRRRNSGVVG